MADDGVDGASTFFELFRFHPNPTEGDGDFIDRRFVEEVLHELACVATKAQVLITTVESCYAVNVDLRTALDARDVVQRLCTIRDEARIEYDKRFAAARTAGFPTDIPSATMASCAEVVQKEFGGRNEQQFLEELLKEHRKPGGRLMLDASTVLGQFMTHGQSTQKEETTG